MLLFLIIKMFHVLYIELLFGGSNADFLLGRREADKNGDQVKGEVVRAAYGSNNMSRFMFAAVCCH